MKLALALLLLAAPAAAHDRYPADCCSDRDCRPISCDALKEIADGRVQDIDIGTVYERHQVRPSFDGRCHVCTIAGATYGSPVCVFTRGAGM